MTKGSRNYRDSQRNWGSDESLVIQSHLHTKTKSSNICKNNIDGIDINQDILSPPHWLAKFFPIPGCPLAHDDTAMLRALSTAALEHAHTRELADEVRHTHTNGSGPDTLEEVRGKGPKGLKLHAVIYDIYIYRII